MHAEGGPAPPVRKAGFTEDVFLGVQAIGRKGWVRCSSQEMAKDLQMDPFGFQKASAGDLLGETFRKVGWY